MSLPPAPAEVPALTRDPADFDEFWATTLAAEPAALDVDHRRLDTPLTRLEVHDVRFTGARGQRIAAWWVRPATGDPVPVVVQFVGYGAGRASWMNHLMWAAAGYGHLVVDTRGQGTDTGDEPCADPAAVTGWGPGFVTRGLEHRDTYYYRRVFVDAVRAVRSTGWLPGADPERVVVLGTSQGGGIALACAALSPQVRAAMLDVPFTCDWRASARDTRTAPFREVAEYIRRRPGSYDQVHARLDYYDGVNLARRCTAPAIVSVADEDTVCPAAGIRAAVRAYGGPVELVAYPYGDHVDDGFFREHAQTSRQMAWLAGHGLAPTG